MCVADHQTAGRGRLGRIWEAPPGSALLCSVLLAPALPVDRFHLVTAAVALAGLGAVEALTSVRAFIKWPNDLLVEPGAKLAGVLAEAEVPSVVVGIGMNLTAAPEGAAMLGFGDRDAVLASLLDHLSPLVADWSTVPGLYRRACGTLGRVVRVELPDETFTGVAADVTDDGHLLVDVGMCLRTVAAADVVHLR
ncbi:MAG: BirA family transcriptional regulator [Acidimicrobiaceae bacterium]|nr:BirA family transcriptional regulator [Acidimicrobiaceae bacterium]MDQ1443857.1 BirA family transcriptional regulator [Acidimicrobiaceae bacterium]